MKNTTLHNDCAALGRRGFSLLELLIVVAILGILSAAVGVYINSDQAKMRTFVFNLSARFKQARFEAIKRNSNVYLDFDFNGDGDLDNGFTLWEDNDKDGAYVAWDVATDDDNGNGVYDPGESDWLIESVVFENLQNGLYGKEGPEIYFTTAGGPTGGPAAGPDAAVIGSGITAAGGRFLFLPNGDCRNAGEAYFYFPKGDVGARAVAGGPWAIKVNGVGRISIHEWLPASGNWKGN